MWGRSSSRRTEVGNDRDFNARTHQFAGLAKESLAELSEVLYDPDDEDWMYRTEFVDRRQDLVEHCLEKVMIAVDRCVKWWDFLEAYDQDLEEMKVIWGELMELKKFAYRASQWLDNLYLDKSHCCGGPILLEHSSTRTVSRCKWCEETL
jgi:hypothetical protein